MSTVSRNILDRNTSINAIPTEVGFNVLMPSAASINTIPTMVGFNVLSKVSPPLPTVPPERRVLQSWRVRLLCSRRRPCGRGGLLRIRRGRLPLRPAGGQDSGELKGGVLCGRVTQRSWRGRERDVVCDSKEECCVDVLLRESGQYI